MSDSRPRASAREEGSTADERNVKDASASSKTPNTPNTPEEAPFVGPQEESNLPPRSSEEILAEWVRDFATFPTTSTTEDSKETK